MDWYIKVIQNYTNFKGRARRKEFWMFYLYNLIIAAVISGIDSLLGFRFGLGYLTLIYFIFLLVPYIALCVRRLHDIGKKGTWLFVGFIPLVGAIWLLVFMVTEGQAFTNEYGPNPKELNEN